MVARSFVGQASVVEDGEGRLQGNYRQKVSGENCYVPEGGPAGRRDEVCSPGEVASRSREEMQVRRATGRLKKARETAIRGGRSPQREQGEVYRQVTTCELYKFAKHPRL